MIALRAVLRSTLARRGSFLFSKIGMMQIKIFTMPFNSQLGIFDDGQFNDFSKDKELVSVNDYLFCRDEIHYLTLVVKYK